MPPVLPPPSPAPATGPVPPPVRRAPVPVMPAGPSVLTRRTDRRSFSSRLVVISFIGDLLVALCMQLLAYWVRFVSPVSVWIKADEMVTLSSYFGQMMLGSTLLMVLLIRFRTYQPGRLLSFCSLAGSIAKATAVWIVAFMGISLVLKFQPGISRLYTIFGFGLITIGLLTWRVFFNRYLWQENVARRLRERVLIIGWTNESQRMVQLLSRGSRCPYEVAGAVEPPLGFGNQAPDASIPVLGHYEETRDLIQKHDIDAVLVSDLNLNRNELTNLAVICEKEMADFKIVPNCFQILLSGLHLESMNGVPVLGVSHLPLHSSFNQYIKRVVDIMGSLFGLLVAVPVLGCFGLLVWLESKGPIFYRQVRVGRDGKYFKILKIRSMRMDSEKHGVGWTVKGDPRVLKVGAFMRKWNIDEIPQFWNVFVGEMSLVGPRPERPELIHDFKEEIPHYNARHSVKPGITGWAQVNGLRGDTDLVERIKCDLYYIDNWNLVWDFQIMVLTFFRRDNAC
jgi:exopolysaccharide biosynthesis polyprenyl glycosylphosphotransferase